MSTTLDDTLTVTGSTSLNTLSATNLTLTGSYTMSSLSLNSLSVIGSSGATAASIVFDGTTAVTAALTVSVGSGSGVTGLSVSIGTSTGTALSVIGNTSLIGTLTIGSATELSQTTDTEVGCILNVSQGLEVSGITRVNGNVYTSGTNLVTLNKTTGNLETPGKLTVNGAVSFTGLSGNSHGGSVVYLLIDWDTLASDYNVLYHE